MDELCQMKKCHSMFVFCRTKRIARWFSLSRTLDLLDWFQQGPLTRPTQRNLPRPPRWIGIPANHLHGCWYHWHSWISSRLGGGKRLLYQRLCHWHFRGSMPAWRKIPKSPLQDRPRFPQTSASPFPSFSSNIFSPLFLSWDWTMVPLDHGIIGPWHHWTMAPLGHGTIGPWHHWTMASLDHGTIGPWHHWTMASLNHGIIGPWQLCFFLLVRRLRWIQSRDTCTGRIMVSFPKSSAPSSMELDENQSSPREFPRPVTSRLTTRQTTSTGSTPWWTPFRASIIWVETGRTFEGMSLGVLAGFEFFQGPVLSHGGRSL